MPAAGNARFIVPDAPCQAVPVLRRHFRLTVPPLQARIFVTYLGIGRLWLNAQPVGEDVLAPGWQSYKHRLVYDAYDVTELLRSGDNVLEAQVADGWYAGRLGFFGQRAVYGADRAVWAQLEILYEDGSLSTIATDADRRWRPGPTLHADLYDGETHDARLEHVTADDRPWRPVAFQDFDVTRLEQRVGPAVRRTEILPPHGIFTTASGKVIVDFGRNIVGWARIQVSGPAGTEVTLRFAEVLDDGELGVRPLRSAAATDRYVLGGTETETWEPSFTYHGFRYLQVDGWPGGMPRPDQVQAVVVHSDMGRTGWFRTSHPELAQLHANVVNSMRGNFVSIPTDCPQRDERLGWTGDIAVFAPTATFLYDCTDLLRSWLIDVAHEQRPDGSLPIFVPQVPFPPSAADDPQFTARHVAVWGDAATLVPFALYDATGDRAILAEHYELMRLWVDGVENEVGPSRIWDRGFQFGDWLDPVAPSDDPAGGATEPALVATAYFANSARLLSRAAAVLGRPDDERRYAKLAAEVADAFRQRFLSDDGHCTSHSQTAYAIVLCLDLANDDRRRAGVSERLVQMVREAGHRIGTGFVGTPLILQALTSAAAIDDAYELLLQHDCPSWLYAVSMGATTIWERWDSMLPDGSINPGEMTSFNHYALGAVADWLHSTVAGLARDAPGYRRIRIAPRPRGPLRDAGATHLTPYGPASVDWRIEGETLVVEIVIPVGTTAVVDIEGSAPMECGAGTHALRFPYPASELPGATRRQEIHGRA
ncbi:alpha-L-rhamnosidase [Kribbella speibonae]|uniref:alpha-L-rhamnosidase n=1 Tax=Kribbella speibonae TaxID=1572660 RepID=A0A4R0IXQ7_9ACTN|nr:alpha-L-rhamnosidase [Kribbella speibonae]TCC36476.1 alpha-L-rhamnosidase [Kribbella speibonae]